MKKILVLILCVLASSFAFATHNRAGEITFTHVSGLTYKVTIWTYTNTCNTEADRPSLTLYWGDGDSSTVYRANGPIVNGVPNGEPTCNCSKKNEYIGEHTYEGPGTYTLSMEDPNRNANIINIPGSVNQVFYIESQLVINPFLGYDNSPVLTNPPSCVEACNQDCFYFNCGAYDPDGDSLAYSLDSCRGHKGQVISGFTFPDATSTFSIDPYSGELTWCDPTQIGLYNVAIRIKEYRHGYFIGSVLRDMQIEVGDCSNNPPNIVSIDDTCVEAGTLVSFPIWANDPDTWQHVTISATGEPFNFNPAADFNVPTNSINPVSGTFSWQTTCSNVRTQPYQITVSAVDDGSPVSLHSYKTINITVVGPAPTNPTAQPSGSSIILNWDPSVCTQVTGYQIYRHNGYTGWHHGPCETGVPAYTGYHLVGTVNGGVNDTTFTDNNNGQGLVHGVDYCYMIVATYPLPDGALSYASDEVCAQLVKDVPVITHVTVDQTDPSQGKIHVKWIKPVADSLNLDTTADPGPYEFKLLRTNGFSTSGFTQIADFTSQYFAPWSDTAYTDTMLNTQDSAYTYRIDFYSNGNLIGSTHTASSVYLSITPSDRKLMLSWQEIVPWTNTQYVVFKQNNASVYVPIDTVTSQSYTDSNLVNHATYCYKIESIGSYSDTTIESPLINYSEEKCGTPIDLIPPCPPVLTVNPDCDLSQNILTWTNPNHYCADDVVLFHIYYTPVEGQDYHLLETITDLTDTTLVQSNMASIAGCYAVTAVDSSGNESAYSTPVCVDNCPTYQLPNVFTPDGDTKNDFFVPLPYKYVKDIDLQIFNRWGQVVFKTTDPDIRWNGDDQTTKQPCPDGTYFYICTVNEIRVTGIEPHILKGFIQLIRGKGGNGG